MLKTLDTINVQACKFDGTVYRTWHAKLLSIDDSLIVLEGTFEYEVNHPAVGHIKKGTRSVEYYWLMRWYSVFCFFEPEGGFRNYYCNINCPPQISDNILRYIDLDIDILVSPFMTYNILDKNEFEENSRKFKYPAKTITEIEKALDELISLIQNRQFPFNLHYPIS